MTNVLAGVCIDVRIHSQARAPSINDGQQLAQDRAMGLGRPLGQDRLEQDLTDPFADRLIAGELREQRVVVLASPSC